MGHEVFTNSQGLVPVASFRYLDTIEMGSEDLIAKDSLNKRDTEWHEHAQSVEEIPYIDQDITRFQQRLNAALMELVEYPTRIPYPAFKKLA